MNIRLVNKEIRSLEVVSNINDPMKLELESNIQYSVEAHLALNQCRSEARVTIQDRRNKEQLLIKLYIVALFDIKKDRNRIRDNAGKKSLHIESYKLIEPFIAKSIHAVFELLGLDAISFPVVDINTEDIMIVDVAKQG